MVCFSVCLHCGEMRSGLSCLERMRDVFSSDWISPSVSFPFIAPAAKASETGVGEGENDLSIIK